jgi:sugar lactone lactonase YvrE
MLVWRTLISWIVVVATATTAAAQILPAGAAATQLVTGYGFTEGPLYDPTVGVAGSVLFTDLNRSDIVRYDIAAGTAAIADPNSGAANGMFFDAGGHLVSADRDRRQISRAPRQHPGVEAASRPTGQAPSPTGPRSVIDAVGGIYFSDPDYSNRQSVPEAVYYISPASLLRPLTQFQRPNGVILRLTAIRSIWPRRQRIYAFDVAADARSRISRLLAPT